MANRANRRVRILRTAKIDGTWTYCKVPFSKNGRIVPSTVIVGGKEVKVPADEGQYYLVFGKKFHPVGNSAADAYNEAERRRSILEAKAKGLDVKDDAPARKHSLAGCIEAFIEEMKHKNRSYNTIVDYTFILNQFAELCGHDYLEDVERIDVLRYTAALRKLKDGLSERTIANRYQVVTSFLNANGRDLMKKGRNGDRPRFEDELPETYTEEELDEFFAECDAEQKDIFKFFLLTGARMKELMFACWSDIKWEDESFRVQAKAAMGFKPKTHEERDIPLEPELLALLKARKKRAVNGCPLIFPTAGCKPNWKLLQACKRIAKRANLNCGQCDSCKNFEECGNYFLHKFRATYATNWLRDGLDARTVQKLLGHSPKDMKSIMRYLRPLEGDELLTKMKGIRATE
jgi:integrase/recombinase XerD